MFLKISGLLFVLVGAVLLIAVFLGKASRWRWIEYVGVLVTFEGILMLLAT